MSMTSRERVARGMQQAGAGLIPFARPLLCERKGWAEEARSYNDLVTSWPAIVEASQRTATPAKHLTML